MSEAPAAAAADVAPSTPLGPADAARAAARAGGARSSPAAEAVAPSPYTPHAGASAAEDESWGVADADTQGSAEAEPLTPVVYDEDEDDDEEDAGPADAAESGPLLPLAVKDEELRPLVEELEKVQASILALPDSVREAAALALDDLRKQRALQMLKRASRMLELLGIDIVQLQTRPNFNAQVSALLATLRWLLLNDKPRGLVVMPCGTGKSFVLAWAVLAFQRFTVPTQGGDKARPLDVLVLAPSIHLVAQLMTSLQQFCGPDCWHIDVICSDSKYASSSQVADDDPEEDVPEEDDKPTVMELKQHAAPGVCVCDDPKYAAMLSRKGESGDEQKKPRLLIATYQSCRGISEAQSGVSHRFDLAVFDEAHHCTSGAGHLMSTATEDKNILIAKRLYLTATPRLLIKHTRKGTAGDDAEVYSMDNECLFGRWMYKLEFREAIARGMLCAPRFVLVGYDVRGEESEESAALRHAVEESGARSPEELARLGALLSAVLVPPERAEDCAEPLPRKVLAFCSTLKDAERLSVQLASVSDSASAEPTAEPDAEPDDRPSLMTESASAASASASAASADCAPEPDAAITASAQAVAAALKPAIKAVYLSGNDSLDERKIKLGIMRECPHTAIVCSARALQEGVDEPSCDTVALMYPCSSARRLVQMIGRAMRLCEGKRFADIIIPVRNDDVGPVVAVLAAMCGVDSVVAGLVRRVCSTAAHSEELKQALNIKIESDTKALFHCTNPGLLKKVLDLARERLSTDFERRIYSQVYSGLKEYLVKNPDDPKLQRVWKSLKPHGLRLFNLRAALANMRDNGEPLSQDDEALQAALLDAFPEVDFAVQLNHFQKWLLKYELYKRYSKVRSGGFEIPFSMEGMEPAEDSVKSAVREWANDQRKKRWRMNARRRQLLDAIKFRWWLPETERKNKVKISTWKDQCKQFCEYFNAEREREQLASLADETGLEQPLQQLRIDIATEDARAAWPDWAATQRHRYDTGEFKRESSEPDVEFGTWCIPLLQSIPGWEWEDERAARLAEEEKEAARRRAETALAEAEAERLLAEQAERRAQAEREAKAAEAMQRQRDALAAVLDAAKKAAPDLPAPQPRGGMHGSTGERRLTDSGEEWSAWDVSVSSAGDDAVDPAGAAELKAAAAERDGICDLRRVLKAALDLRRDGAPALFYLMPHTKFTLKSRWALQLDYRDRTRLFAQTPQAAAAFAAALAAGAHAGMSYQVVTFGVMHSSTRLHYEFDRDVCEAFGYQFLEQDAKVLTCAAPPGGAIVDGRDAERELKALLKLAKKWHAPGERARNALLHLGVVPFDHPACAFAGMAPDGIKDETMMLSAAAWNEVSAFTTTAGLSTWLKTLSESVELKVGDPPEGPPRSQDPAAAAAGAPTDDTFPPHPGNP